MKQDMFEIRWGGKEHGWVFVANGRVVNKERFKKLARNRQALVKSATSALVDAWQNLYMCPELVVYNKRGDIHRRRAWG